MADNRRGNRFLITVSDELLAKLDNMAEKIGVPRASLAVMYIAEAIRSREQSEYFMAQLPEQIKTAISNPEVVKELTKNSK